MKVVDISSLRNERSDIPGQARAWVIRLEAEDLAQEECLEFNRWLATSEAHRQAFGEAKSLWSELDGMGALLGADDAGAQKAPWRWWKAGAACAVLLLGGVSLVMYWHATVQQAQTLNAEYGTGVGEIRTVALPDGSNLSLNTSTSLAVNYRGEARFIRLAEGEAFFEVAHDPTKPFLVYAGNHVVRAIGTAFSVAMHEGSIDVVVTDGRVEVSSYDRQVAEEPLNLKLVEGSASRVPLDKGQHGIFNEIVGQLEMVQRLQPDAIERDLAWRDGILAFDNDSLENVIKEVGRYTPVRIVISDPSIRDMRFGGYFKVGDLAAILDTIQSDYGVQVDEIDDKLIYLSRQK